MIGQNWRCPHCESDQVVSDERYHRDLELVRAKGAAEGSEIIAVTVIICANNTCRKTTLSVSIGEFYYRGHSLYASAVPRASWRLLPSASVKDLPDYVPRVIRQDYREAQLIRFASPKASATLARRCMQGMIREFFGISKRNLAAEINELRRQAEAAETKEPVTLDILDAIDAIRQVGNIGAHMEADIDVIVDVEPEEANTLLQLLEVLFKEWYGAREDRRERLRRVQDLATQKAEQKKLPPPEAPE